MEKLMKALFMYEVCLVERYNFVASFCVIRRNDYNKDNWRIHT